MFLWEESGEIFINESRCQLQIIQLRELLLQAFLPGRELQLRELRSWRHDENDGCGSASCRRCP